MTKFKIICPTCGQQELEVKNLRNGQQVEICGCGFPQNEGYIVIEKKKVGTK